MLSRCAVIVAHASNIVRAGIPPTGDAGTMDCFATTAYSRYIVVVGVVIIVIEIVVIVGVSDRSRPPGPSIPVAAVVMAIARTTVSVPRAVVLTVISARCVSPTTVSAAIDSTVSMGIGPSIGTAIATTMATAVAASVSAAVSEIVSTAASMANVNNRQFGFHRSHCDMD
jgi:hypothetical protein